MSVPVEPSKIVCVDQCIIKERVKGVFFIDEFIDPINEIMRILNLPKILGGEKREMTYNLKMLKRNIERVLMHRNVDRRVLKFYLKKPVQRCLKLVTEKGFCHTQRNLMKAELNRVKSRLEQLQSKDKP